MGNFETEKKTMPGIWLTEEVVSFMFVAQQFLIGRSCPEGAPRVTSGSLKVGFKCCMFCLVSGVYRCCE